MDGAYAAPQNPAPPGTPRPGPAVLELGGALVSKTPDPPEMEKGAGKRPARLGPRGWPRPAAAEPRSAGGDSDDEAPPDRGGARPHNLPSKTSIGIILCRQNAKTGRPEVILVHKRYTYAFAEFVHGHYARGWNTAVSLRSIAHLLDGMTTEELFDVWSLSFEQMWFRIWLSHDKRDLYNKRFAKFQAAFIQDDNGIGLQRAIKMARPHGSLLWEVPKGRRLNQREADIACAVRELREETGIDKSDYRILPGVKRRVCYVSAGTRYVCIYYIAIANPRLSGDEFDDGWRPTLRDIHQMGEVSKIRWHDVERIRGIDEPGSRLESLVAPAFRLVKQYLRGRWGSRRPPAEPAAAPMVGPEDPPRPKALEGSGPGPGTGPGLGPEPRREPDGDGDGWRQVRRGRRGDRPGGRGPNRRSRRAPPERQ